MSLLTIVAQVLLGATLPNSPGGYFYGLTDPSGFYFLVRMDAEGNVDRLGERGSVGLPPVGGLAWDNYRNRLVGWRLLGNANQTVQWIEFDVATGAPRILSSSSFPTGLEGFTHGHPQSAAFHPKTGMLYAIVEQVGIMKIDIDTGESHPVNAGFEYNRITWVDGFLGEFTGFIAATRNNPKLVYFDTASWNSVPIGGLPESQNVRVSFWDDSQHTLFAMYGFGPFTDGTLFAFDEINGFDLDVGTIGTHDGTRVTAFAFVAGDVPNNPQCFDFDTDFDEDIDLRDFANFTNCMTAPRQQEED